MINKNYLKYLFKSKKIAWVFFLGMYMAICLPSFISVNNDVAGNYSFALNCSVVLALAMTFILPVFLFSFVHKKRSCDVYFALPVKRSELLWTTVLFSFLITFGYFLITVIVATLITISHTGVTLFELALFICFMSIGILSLLIIHSCIYLFANNMFDGIVMLVSYVALPVAFLLVVSTICDKLQMTFIIRSLQMNYLSPLSTVLINAECLIGKIEILKPVQYLNSVTGDPFSFSQILVLIGYAAVAVLLLKVHFINRKNERAEQVSNELLSYPIIINVYLICLLLTLAFADSSVFGEMIFILYAGLFFVYMTSLFVYKRKIKIYWKNAVYFIVVALVTIGFAQISYINKGFGIPYAYPVRSGETVTYSYQAYNLDTELNEKEPGPSDEYSITVSFDLIMNTNSLDEENKNVFEMMEKYRTKLIDKNLENREYYPSYNGSLSISNDIKNKNVNHDYYWAMSTLRLEELKEISKYTKVEVDVYDYENDTDEIYTLNEYLERFA